MKKDYKISYQRLATFFETSRDKWKARSKVYQTEKRALQTRVRDLERSVVLWRTKYELLQKEVKKKESQYPLPSKPSLIGKPKDC